MSYPSDSLSLVEDVFNHLDLEESEGISDLRELAFDRRKDLVTVRNVENLEALRLPIIPLSKPNRTVPFEPVRKLPPMYAFMKRIVPSKIHSLELLDANKLPKEVLDLPNLMELILVAGILSFDGIERLQSLRTLRVWAVYTDISTSFPLNNLCKLEIYSAWGIVDFSLFRNLRLLSSLSLTESKVTFGSGIEEMQSLTKVKMISCKLEKLPLAFGRLRLLKLEMLDISSFKKFPRCITNITTLATLFMSNNIRQGLGNIPKEIERLTSLKTLGFSRASLSNNDVKRLCLVTSLKYLSFMRCKIKSIPKDIENLKNLTTLELAQNPICEIPPSLSKLSNLESLNLWRTKVLTIPTEVCLMTMGPPPPTGLGRRGHIGINPPDKGVSQDKFVKRSQKYNYKVYVVMYLALIRGGLSPTIIHSIMFSWPEIVSRSFLKL
jgi:hypothetical protein